MRFESENKLPFDLSVASIQELTCVMEDIMEMMNWKTCMRTHLVEGDAELLDSASSVSLADAGGKDSTITSTSRNFDELPYWEFRYIRDIIRSLDLVLEDFILGEAQSIMALDLFDQLENQKTQNE
ncbi:hypothetical protein RND71_014233 [Anisodus tanguticus]|uniref:Uncharacterized protein n=1 Tax=Anisodus tanguticus TaxID=243964 RepID=A0AAE1VDZ5_9SOLA|nr:hypothetical protein RND71_014233 [Anisodus tanguticus]